MSKAGRTVQEDLENRLPSHLSGSVATRNRAGHGLQRALADEPADAFDRFLALWQETGEELPDVDHFRPYFKFYLNFCRSERARQSAYVFWFSLAVLCFIA